VGVAAVRAVVTEHEVLALRNDNLLAVGRVVVAGLEPDVRLVQQLIGNEHLATLDTQAVAG